MNTGNTLRALQEAELTKEQAFADDYPYGISTCLRMMGNIYFARREYRTALDYYQQSLVYTQEKLPEQDLSYIYWNISMLQQNLKQMHTFIRARQGGRVQKLLSGMFKSDRKTW